MESYAVSECNNLYFIDPKPMHPKAKQHRVQSYENQLVKQNNLKDVPKV